MPDFLDGHHIIVPTSISSTGTGNSSTINPKGSVTFSTCATLSLNGVFSADYDNYMIVMRHLNTSGDGAGYIRLRVAGSDNLTASSYVYQTFTATSTTLSGARTTSDAASWGPVSATQRSGTVIYVYGPYLAQPTAFRGITTGGQSSAYLQDSAFTHNQSVSYDGFTLSDSVLAQSGLICVYGMVK